MKIKFCTDHVAETARQHDSTPLPGTGTAKLRYIVGAAHPAGRLLTLTAKVNHALLAEWLCLETEVMPKAIHRSIDAQAHFWDFINEQT